MFDIGHDLTVCRAIGTQLVGDDPLRQASLFLHQADQEALGRLGVAALLDDFIENIAVLVDRPPQPVLLAGDCDYDLVKMPDVAGPRCLPPQSARIVRPEFPCPAADGLVGDDNTTLE